MDLESAPPLKSFKIIQLLWDDNAADLFIPNFFDKTPKSFKIKYDQVDGGADEENPQSLQENAMDFKISST